MLHEVMIDGIKYVPQATIQPTDDATLRAALHELVSLHYFGQWHKAQGVTGLVIEMLSPELSKVMESDIGAAFERTSSTD
ncbi:MULTISPECIES: hypothetical protein [Aeromonas]|uniref:Uncharacterized protein n=1 Tax=Aeromonas veronii TaxID=654 RepID=A0A653KZN1_AERVE|nr:MULTISPECIES: hypothetical protein [Aeromonas]GKQ96007.1 hypothetical protein KAM461_02570 [Aeromonas hydrophila]VXA84024.1 conserved hypothetical protein [Aeromonas veronii]